MPMESRMKLNIGLTVRQTVAILVAKKQQL